MWPGAAFADPTLPAGVLSALRGSGLPMSSFGLHVEAIDGEPAPALASLNGEKPFLLASTAKLVTSLAALDLLGEDHAWKTRAWATGPVVDGKLEGDLVIVGGSTGLTPATLRQWFRQIREEGLSDVSGNIVLQRFSLLHEQHPAQAATTAAERSPGLDPLTYTKGTLTVAVQPARGARARVTLAPWPLGIVVINEVAMGGGCSAWAHWQPAGAGVPQLRVSGRWDADCGKRAIAYVRPPATLPKLAVAAAQAHAVSTPRMVSSIWAETGGTLRGRVLEKARRPLLHDVTQRPDAWVSEVSTALPEVIREMNKTSNNVAARSLMLALAPRLSLANGALAGAQARVRAWLRGKGLGNGDLHLDIGSGQSRAERGKPRALVRLLRDAWRERGARAFIESLPVAGVDGTLAHRMRDGSATGQAFLKTGTLHDARALAGYVRGESGTVYAVAALVNHPKAARATPALDSLIEWVAKNG